MECPKLSDCPFFNFQLKDMPTTADTLKSIFCKKDYKKCARYIVSSAIGKENVPDDLFPNDEDRVDAILKGKK